MSTSCTSWERLWIIQPLYPYKAKMALVNYKSNSDFQITGHLLFILQLSHVIAIKHGLGWHQEDLVQKPHGGHAPTCCSLQI